MLQLRLASPRIDPRQLAYTLSVGQLRGHLAVIDVETLFLHQELEPRERRRRVLLGLGLGGELGFDPFRNHRIPAAVEHKSHEAESAAPLLALHRPDRRGADSGDEAGKREACGRDPPDRTERPAGLPRSGREGRGKLRPHQLVGLHRRPGGQRLLRLGRAHPAERPGRMPAH